MPKATPIITQFNGGEWSPRMYGRVDLEGYRQACQVMENFIAQPHGPATKRPGTRFIASAKNSDKAARLIPFIFSDQQTYVLEFGDQYIRFYADEGQVTSGGSPYEITSPYASADLDAIQYAQTADVMYLVHPDYSPRKLSRVGATSWTLSEITFNDGPYRALNEDLNLFITPSATTGSDITLTAQYEYGDETTGTWDDTLSGSAISVFGSGDVAGFRFSISDPGYLHQVKVQVTSSSTGTNNITTYLYSDDGTSPDALLETATDTFDSSSTGEYEITFSGTYQLIADTDYWIVWEPSANDAASFNAVDNNSAYGSGTAATIGGITNNETDDFRVELTYQPTGPASLWDEDQVGALWRLKHSGNRDTTSFGATGTGDPIKLRGKFFVDLAVHPTDGWRGKITIQRSHNGVTWKDFYSVFYSTQQEFFESEEGVYYRAKCVSYQDGVATVTIYQDEHWGEVKISDYVSASEVKANVIHDFASTDRTAEWREGAWSDYRGWPTTVTFHENRLWFAANTAQPQTLWSSWVGDYEEFMPADQADSPLEFTLLSEQVNSIQWILSQRSIVIGTVASEWRLGGQSLAEPLSATNVQANREATHGSASPHRPLMISSRILFLQTLRRKLRGLVYEYSTDSWTAPDLTTFSEHITEGGISELSYQQEPDGLIWAIRNDGALIGLTFDPDQKVVAWHKHTTQGEVESTAVIPSGFSSAGNDQLWMLVKRTINGTTKRFVELMESNYGETAIEDMVYLDCSLSYDGTVDDTETDTLTFGDDEITFGSGSLTFGSAGTKTFSGLDHLAGETISVLADGYIHPDVTVSDDGEITLDYEAEKVVVGLSYTAKLQIMSLEAGTADGTSQSRHKRIHEVMVRLYNTWGGQVGPDADHVDPIRYTTASDTLNPKPEMFTGDKRIPYRGGWEYSAAPMIIHSEPMPCTVQAIIAKLVASHE